MGVDELGEDVGMDDPVMPVGGWAKITDPEKKAKWVRELRTGGRCQTTGLLRRVVRQKGYGKTGPGYCCLGVACETFEEEAGLKRRVNLIGDRWEWDGCYASLPDTLVMYLFGEGGMKWNGVAEEIQLVLDKLVYMNDKQGCTFDDIANWIEREL